jgi:hypothetical protein
MRVTIFYGLPLLGNLWEIHVLTVWGAPLNNLTMRVRASNGTTRDRYLARSKGMGRREYGGS